MKKLVLLAALFLGTQTLAGMCKLAEYQSEPMCDKQKHCHWTAARGCVHGMKHLDAGASVLDNFKEHH